MNAKLRKRADQLIAEATEHGWDADVITPDADEELPEGVAEMIMVGGSNCRSLRSPRSASTNAPGVWSRSRLMGARRYTSNTPRAPLLVERAASAWGAVMRDPYGWCHLT